MADNKIDKDELRHLIEALQASGAGNTLDVDNILKIDRANMAEQCLNVLAQLATTQGLAISTVIHMFDGIDDERVVKLLDMLKMTVAVGTIAFSTIVAGLAKWNALHPTDEPLGNAENLAEVAKALNKQAN